MRRQSTLTFNKNSSIHLKFQFCDIIPPDTRKTTLLLVPSGGQSSLFSCVCVCSAKLSTSVQASRCYWKATIRRKPACKKTENSFSLYVNLRGGKREKKKKEKAQIIFLLASSSTGMWLLTRWRTGDLKVRWMCKSNDSKTSSAMNKKAAKEGKECANSIISSPFQSSCFRNIFQGKILLWFSGFLLCKMNAHAAKDNTFAFGSQGRKELASTESFKYHSTHRTTSIICSHCRNSSYKNVAQPRESASK